MQVSSSKGYRYIFNFFHLFIWLTNLQCGTAMDQLMMHSKKEKARMKKFITCRQSKFTHSLAHFQFIQVSRLQTTSDLCREVYEQIKGELKNPLEEYALFWPEQKVQLSPQPHLQSLPFNLFLLLPSHLSSHICFLLQQWLPQKKQIGLLRLKNEAILEFKAKKRYIKIRQDQYCINTGNALQCSQLSEILHPLAKIASVYVQHCKKYRLVLCELLLLINCYCH